MKTKHLFYILAVIAIGAYACGSNEDKKVTPPPAEALTTADPEDSTTEELLDTVFSRENIDSFSTMAFTSYAKKQASDFDWSRFRMEHNWVEDSLMVRSFKPNKDFYNNYGRFLKYSPDSTLFIDLDSYSVQIKKDKKGRYVGTELEADTEVGLVNLKEGTKTRLLFLGPENSIEDALWLDKETVAIMGIEGEDSIGKIAAVWKIHIPTKTFSLYELKDSAAARRLMGYWRKERLKGVVMN